MKFLSGLVHFIYALLITGMCAAGLLFVSHAIEWSQVEYYLSMVYNSDRLRWYVGLVCGTIIFLTYLFESLIASSQQKERTIAFDNPMGRVSVSLSAVEDLVKRLIYREPEIREVRSMVLATKRGLRIETRMTLKTEVNIPEMTSRLQELIKNKIHETLGVDEPVMIQMHVIKIVSDSDKQKKHKDKEAEKETPEELAVPFQGYRS